MANFSFDVVSDFDKAEMNNVINQAKKEISSRYDLKGTAASIEFTDNTKSSVTITGDNQFQLDAIMDIVRKKASSRGVSQKTFDTTLEPTTTNLKMTQVIKFRKGLDAANAKHITKLIRDEMPKVKTSIQGEEVRVISPKKDELQQVMNLLRSKDFDFPIDFTNFR